VAAVRSHRSFAAQDEELLSPAWRDCRERDVRVSAQHRVPGGPPSADVMALAGRVTAPREVIVQRAIEARR